MKMSEKQYGKYVKEKSPKSPLGRDMLFAFLIGGAICTVGQVVNNILLKIMPNVPDASAMTSVCMVFLGAFLTALRIYDNIAKYGGAGTLVPITGFANAMVSPAMEFKSEGIITGLCTKMFTIAGPVIVFGLIASYIYGIYLLIFG
ncbi:MAG: SpoVA/SpoVAEb family sporulation membrane protein [Clostridiales bacterium]|nr:SpoVA/SpoVAEb family sporulation membrane protein [Clostridiales bacterium]